MRMRWKKKICQCLLPLVCSAFLLSANELAVEASTGTITYGSEGYEWELDTTNPIGIYVVGDEVIADYEVVLSYDETMLRYVSGASEQDGNLLYIRGEGSEMRYKTMLHFETLRAGSTQLEVVKAVGHTEPKVGENGELEPVIEEFQMDTSLTAPIYVPRPEDGGLLELVTEPQELVGFSADVMEYFIEVPAEVEKLDVSYIPESDESTVEVSDTALKVGENVITVLVKSEEGNTAYAIHVTRQMPPEPTEAPTQAPTEAPPKPTEAPTKEPVTEPTAEPTEEKEGFAWSWKLFQGILLGVGCLLVAGLAVMYVMAVMKERKRIQRRVEKKSSNDDASDMETTVISVSNVTMRFKRVTDEASSLKETFIRLLKRQNDYTYVKVLNNISFDIKQGEVVGIIGTNGSGKSTMLKILSGALKPTKGRVYVDHSKVQMLTLGTGFDMELTARENVYLNGSIIGYTKEFIDEKYDEIVKFAELEGFMDERMKNFSSGMVSRLGFAIATMRDAPDILILDEVLSVGDAFFRQKSEKRIRELIHSGATVIIVSHSANTILKNCTKVIWIEKGVLQMIGDPKTVCEAYRKL